MFTKLSLTQFDLSFEYFKIFFDVQFMHIPIFELLTDLCKPSFKVCDGDALMISNTITKSQNYTID